MEFITIDVEERAQRGSRAMQRLRAEARVPAVLYGLGRRNLPLTMPEEALEHFLASGSHLVELKMGGDTRDAILREVQVDPLSDRVLHVDFQRVDKAAPVEDHVPIQYKGTPKGVAVGGIFQPLMEKLGVRARPRDLPHDILIEVQELELGDEIKVRDLVAPPGVEFTDDPDMLVVHCVAARGTAEDEPTEEAPAPTEPEIVGKSSAAEGETDAE